MAMLGQFAYCALAIFLSISFGLTGAWAAAPSRSRTYTTGQTIEAGDVTANEDSIFSYLQAGVDTYATGTVNAAAIADNAVGASEIAAGAVDAGDMATTGTIADDKVFVADSSSAGTWRAISNVASGSFLTYSTSTNTFSTASNASTATNLAANGANCSAGNYARGVDAAGAAENCTAVATSVAVGSFTRDTTAASGTQAVTGTGFTPKLVFFFAVEHTVVGEISWGFSNNTTELAVADRHNNTASTWLADANDCIHDEESGTNQYEGDVSSFDSDGFTINWTRTGTPTGTLDIYYTAFQ